MIIAVPKELHPGEKRVALVPAAAATLIKAGHQVRVEQSAGLAAGFPDDEYVRKGCQIATDRRTLLNEADIVLQVRAASATTAPQALADIESARGGQLVIGYADPLTPTDALRQYADKGVTLIAMELIPRITRAQSMDALSSQANLAGYKAVLVAANTIGRAFPMMMTAAGTLQPAKVFIVGAGVAGLQAIATAKRLGAVVSAYDVRPAVKEQVQSLGGKFVELPIETANAEDKGGYAKAQSEEQIRKQQELMGRTVADSDVVITTALIPGKPAPKLITRAQVEQMRPGSVVVDLAAERGGNCELTQPGQTIDHNGVTIVGDDNLIASVAHDASQMYANNLLNLLKHLIAKDGALKLDPADEINAGATVTRDGDIVHPRVREALNLPPLNPKPEPAAAAAQA